MSYLINKSIMVFHFVIKMVNGKFMIFFQNSILTEAQLFQTIKLLLFSIKQEQEALI